VCDADLEDELIRALGPRRSSVSSTHKASSPLSGDSRNSPRSAPAMRTRSCARFMGTRSGRKIRYGALLIDALELERVPRSLDLVLAAV
jgi:hypothetical protein